MQEIINCPSCQRKLQVPETLLGQDVQCPTCGATFTAAAGGPPPTAAAPPPPAAEGYDLSPAPPERRDSGRSRRYDDYDDYDDLDRPRRARRDLLPHRGTTILVLGILSLVVCGLLGPVAWIMGNQDLAEIRAGRMDPEGEGMTTAGRICGMIASIFLIFGFLIGCLYMFIVMMAVGGAGRRGF